MKGVCFKNVGQIETLNMAQPEIEMPGDAILKVTMAGLCGSDLHLFHGREVGVDQGTVMGHEVVGEVVAVGSDVNNLSVGDSAFAPFTTNCGHCYYCLAGLTARCVSGQLFGWRENNQGLHGCQSEFVRVPLADGTLKKKPAGLSDVSALLLADNFSTGFFCAEMADITPEKTVVVIGCGTVGLLSIIAAKHLGAETIYAIDPIPQRRKEAESLGAQALDANEQAIAEIKNATNGRGADSVMELVGNPAAQRLAYQIMRPGGTMSVVGCHCTPDFAFSPIDAFDKNLTYRTGRCPARFYMDKLTDRVANGEFDIDAFVTHHFALDDSVQAYDVFSNRKDGCVKAVFEF